MKKALRNIGRAIVITAALVALSWGVGYWFGKGWTYAQPDVHLHVQFEDETNATP